ncbi:rho GTPase-activating protein 1-like isoform X2 [Typha angustifolia]
MTQVLLSPSHLPSSPSPPLSCNSSDISPTHLGNQGLGATVEVVEEDPREGRKRGAGVEEEKEEELPVLALLFTLLRKSLLSCKTEGDEEEESRSMEIGWPTEVRHVAHVTFDRFHGFLGLPVEFEPEVPHRAPSASTNVFGVSAESMQCSYDSRGNSVPTLLLLMQRRLYEQGGLQAEGIFRINAENSQEEYVRDQLNRGVVPDGIDVHCLAGLIKAWFRELPSGLLDSLPPEEVMQCQTEEDCAQLGRRLPPTKAALLDWAINLMADVVYEEQRNKMNAHNVATVFAPNMTQMADPLTALMYAVQVMNFLKMLIMKALKERQEPNLEDSGITPIDPSDDNGHQNPQIPLEACSEEAPENVFVHEEPNSTTYLPEENSPTTESADTCHPPHENVIPEGAETRCRNEPSSENLPSMGGSTSGPETAATGSKSIQLDYQWNKTGWCSGQKRGTRKVKGQTTVRAALPAEKSKGTSIVSRINTNLEHIESWR